MDCDKFEDLMLGELYGELDELTSASVNRHVSQCARCAALLAGLKATRTVSRLPVLTPSPGFEERLLAAVRDAERDVTPRVGLAEIISLAGRWAMRPQTAMAAVFLLMVGTMSVLVARKGPKSATEESKAAFTVTENGAPAPPAAPGPGNDSTSLDPLAAAAAHGAAPAFARAPSPAPSLPGPMSKDSLTPGDQSGARASVDDSHLAKPRAATRSLDRSTSDELGESSRARGPGGFAPPPPPPAAPGSPASGLSDSPATSGGGGAYDATATPATALTAARTARDGAGGCAAAAPRFEAVAQSAWGTSAGYDATLEGARCYAQLGQTEAARSRFDRLLTVPAYASRAQSGINAISLVASKSRPSPAKPAAAAEVAPAAVTAPASPPTTATAAAPPVMK